MNRYLLKWIAQSQALKTNRSEFIREVLKFALQRQKILDLERCHAEGYA